MKLLLLLCAAVLAVTACKRRSKPDASAQAPAVVATIPPASLAELNAANAVLTRFANQTGTVPGDLKDALAKGAVPSTLIAPPGMRLHYDAALPSIGFVPAK